MTIHFVCVCGKHLRAREQMAGRRSQCPTCGAPVGIPKLQPTHRGATLGPMSPAELFRSKRCVPSTPVFQAEANGTATLDRPHAPANLSRLALQIDFDGPLDTAAVQEIITRNPSISPQRRHWYHLLLFTPGAALRLLGNGLGLTAVTGSIIALLPQIMVELHFKPAGAIIGLCLMALVPLAVFCRLFSFWDMTLAMAAAGDEGWIAWPGRNIGPVFKSAGRWLACFLAGPVIPVVGGFFYWLNCGDPALVDWLIMVELILVAVGYGLFALVTVSENDRLLDLNPARVTETVYRLGYRGLLTAAVASLLLIGQGVLIYLGAREFAQAAGHAWLLLAGSWIGGLFLLTFVFRILGFCCRSLPPVS